ncbi:MAG: putative enoyl-CoA hydratase paaG [Mycobacterium sp.]|nr:putative enoyl-CoA hydratase paaG [Mycobacterium sp.]
MQITQTENLRVDRDGGLLRLTITRPSRMNAIDLASMIGIGDVLTEAATDSSVRVVVLTGEGKAFCSGADLSSPVQDADGRKGSEIVMDTADRMIRSVVTAPVPVIARINGPAAGVGLSLALAADLIYAAESTYLLMPFINIGLMPDGGATALVAAAVGRVRAAELSLLGERLPVAEAAAAGLITKALPHDQLDAHVDAVAARLARGPRRALELTKASINAATLTELDAALERETVGQIELMSTTDFIEGATAVLTRRQPNFGS